MVTPVKYVLSAIIKKGKELLFVKTDLFIQLTKKVDSSYHLNVDSVHTLQKFIYSVLLWGTKQSANWIRI